MSLTALPVTSSDLTTLQQGLTFTTNAAQAAQFAAAINAPGSTTTVFTYAAQLLGPLSSPSLSQIAMGNFAVMTGATDTVAHMTGILGFLQSQQTFGASKGFDGFVFASEAYGSALSTNAAFNTAFVAPFSSGGNPSNISGFAAAVSAATGVSSAAIIQFASNWNLFFTAHPEALQGRSEAQAVFGTTFGDAMGVALTNSTSANLATVFSTNPAFPFSPNTVAGLVANALIDNAEGSYTAGVALGALPPHQLLQGEAGVPPGTFILTVNIDSGPAFTTNIPNATFIAPPGSTV